jgi:flagellar basal body P-ring protein FlgI
MTMKSLLCVAVLALASSAVANAKSYDIVLNDPVKAGSVQIKPGAYTVKVKGDTAVFTSVSSGKTYTAPVKIESNGPKNDVTTVRTDTENGVAVLKAIRLGGSTTTLEFNE